MPKKKVSLSNSSGRESISIWKSHLNCVNCQRIQMFFDHVGFQMLQDFLTPTNCDSSCLKKVVVHRPIHTHVTVSDLLLLNAGSRLLRLMHHRRDIIRAKIIRLLSCNRLKVLDLPLTSNNGSRLLLFHSQKRVSKLAGQLIKVPAAARENGKSQHVRTIHIHEREKRSPLVKSGWSEDPMLRKTERGKEGHSKKLFIRMSRS